MVVSPDGTRAYTGFYNEGTGRSGVAVIDTRTNAVVTRVGADMVFDGLAITPDGDRVYFTNLDGTVSVLDTLTNTVTDTITVGETPSSVTITPDGAHAYVTNYNSDTVSVIAIEVPATLSGHAPVGVVGEFYSHSFTVTGRPEPVVTVTAGQLPEGLTLTSQGMLSGTPTVAGEYRFTVTASNGVGPAATLEVALEISGGAPVDPIPGTGSWGSSSGLIGR